MRGADWQLTPLSEILIERKENPNPTDLEMGRIRIVSKIGFAEGRIELRNDGATKTNMILIQPGDLVLSGINAIKGAIAIYDPRATQPIAATIHYSAYAPKTDRIDLRFLWWFFRSQSFREIVSEYVPGGIKSELKSKRLLPIPIPLPSLQEQRRIVTRIEALAAKITEAEKLRRETAHKVDFFHSSIMRAACEGQLVPQEINSESVEECLSKIGKSPLVTPRLSILPKGWCWARAEDICGFITKGTTPSADKLFSGSGDIPFIKVYNLTFDGALDFSINPVFVSKDTHTKELARSKVKPGDVLMNIVGPPLGKVSIVPDSFPEWNINQAVVRFRPLEFCNREYLSIVLRTENILDAAINLAKGTAGQANLTLEICRNLPIPLPPLEEQLRIVAYINRFQAKIDELKRLQAKSQAELEALMPSVLARAFGG